LYDDIKKELLIHKIALKGNGIVSFEGKSLPVSHCAGLFKAKAKASYEVVEKLWDEVCSLLSEETEAKTNPPEGIDSVFVHALQGLYRMLYLYPGLLRFDEIQRQVGQALCRDINSFSYRVMSKIIEYKLGIEWVSHLIAKNLYIRALLLVVQFPERKEVSAKGVHGPYSNLDIPMQERVFSWSAIDEEVRGRGRDIRNQRRYRMGLEGYHDPWVNEGFKWRELRNEPYLWGKREDESPYPRGTMRP